MKQRNEKRSNIRQRKQIGETKEDGMQKGKVIDKTHVNMQALFKQ